MINIDWDKLGWRHHDNGLLQAYISDNLRLHIWHRKLLCAGRWDGPVHNHRADLEIDVLHGYVHSSEVKVTEVNPGDSEMLALWECVNASKTSEKRKVCGCTVSIAGRRVYKAGESYSVKKGEYHFAQPPIDGIAVTLVTMGEKEGWSRIVGYQQGEPSAKVHTELPDCAAGLIAEAREVLE